MVLRKEVLLLAKWFDVLDLETGKDYPAKDYYNDEPTDLANEGAPTVGEEELSDGLRGGLDAAIVGVLLLALGLRLLATHSRAILLVKDQHWREHEDDQEVVHGNDDGRVISKRLDWHYFAH